MASTKLLIGMVAALVLLALPALAAIPTDYRANLTLDNAWTDIATTQALDQANYDNCTYTNTVIFPGMNASEEQAFIAEGYNWTTVGSGRCDFGNDFWGAGDTDHEFSINLWFKPVVVAGDDWIWYSKDEINAGLKMSDNQLKYRVRYPGGWQEITYAMTNVTNWSMATLTFAGDNNNMWAYIDGNPISNKSGFAMTTDTTGFAIGGEPGNGNTPFNGYIDEILIYNRSLSAAEVSDMHDEYRADAAPPPPPPSGTSNFSVTSSVNVFNATVGNDGAGYADRVFVAASGTAITFIPQNSTHPAFLVNVTARANLSFDVVLEDVNASTNLTINFTSHPTIATFDIDNSTPVLFWNVSINGSILSATTGNRSIPVSGVHNLTIMANNYATLYLYNYNISENLRANLSYWYGASTNHTGNHTEFSNQTVNLLINTTASVTSTAAVLVYNGTSYTASTGTSGNATLYYVTLDTPSVESYSTLNFTWYFNVTRASGTTASYENGIHTITPINASMWFADPILVYENTTLNLTVNTTAVMTGAYASLTWNGTNYAVTRTNGTNNVTFSGTVLPPDLPAGTNFTFTWTYNISTASDSTEHTVGDSQILVSYGFDNCTTYTTVAVNFTIKNETNGADLNGTMDGHFEAWVSLLGSYKKFNLSWIGGNYYGLCMNPGNRTFGVDAQLEYAAPGMTTKTYYFNNATFTDTTQYIDLWLTSGTTPVTFTVTDQNDNAVGDVFIYILSYDLPTDSYVTTEIIKTDSYGQAIGNIVLSTEYYKFILYHDGELVLETTPVIITTTTRTFQINLQANYFENYNRIINTDCSIDFTNATKNFRYTYANSDGTVTQGCLRVLRRSINGDTEINTSCQSGAANTILVNIGNATGTNTYIATGSVYIGSQQFMCGEPESVSFNALYETYGASGLLMAFFFIVTIVMIGLWNPIVAVFLLVVAVVLTNILGIFHLNWPALIAFIILGGITLYRLKK